MTGQQPVEPPAQRVASQRRGPIAVVLVALAVIATLVWRPWDGASPTPSEVALGPSPSPGLQVTSAPTALPTQRPTADPVATPGASPTPAGPTLTPIPVEFDLASGGPSTVTCGYTDKSRAAQLRMITVEPPVIVARHSARGDQIERVGWRFEVQSNHVDTLFSAAWQDVARSKRQVVPVGTGGGAGLRPLTLSLAAGRADPTSVVPGGGHRLLVRCRPQACGQPEHRGGQLRSGRPEPADSARGMPGRNHLALVIDTEYHLGQ